MTTNIFGPGHYPATGESASRPTPIATGKAFDTWFAQCESDGTGGTAIDEMWLNFLMASLRQLVRLAGAQEGELNELMLSEAVARVVSGVVACSCSGLSIATAYTVSASGTFVPPTSLFDGLEIEFVPNVDCGATPTINAFDLGIKAARSHLDTPLNGKEMLTGRPTVFRYSTAANSAAGAWLMRPWANPMTDTSWGNLPIFPEITTAGNALATTTSTGQIVISTGQGWSHRGWAAHLSDDFSLSDRTFNTSANKTYHLRWYAPGTANAPRSSWPGGRFMLRDLADGAYNAAALLEGNAAFDTAYDDMLIARVVTNGSNALTVTALKNKARLLKAFTVAFTGLGNVTTYTQPAWSFALNWSRTPEVAVALPSKGSNESASPFDQDYGVDASATTRYAVSGALSADCIDSYVYIGGMAVS